MESSKCRKCRIPDQCPFRAEQALFEEIQGYVEWRWYSAHCSVFQRGQPASGLYVIQSGRVALHLGTGNKKTHFGDALPGWVLGVGETLDGSGYLFSAETEEETEVEFVAKEPLLSLLQSQPGFAPILLTTVAYRTNELIAQLLSSKLGSGER